MKLLIRFDVLADQELHSLHLHYYEKWQLYISWLDFATGPHVRTSQNSIWHVYLMLVCVIFILATEIFSYRQDPQKSVSHFWLCGDSARYRKKPVSTCISPGSFMYTRCIPPFTWDLGFILVPSERLSIFSVSAQESNLQPLDWRSGALTTELYRLTVYIWYICRTPYIQKGHIWILPHIWICSSVLIQFCS